MVVTAVEVAVAIVEVMVAIGEVAVAVGEVAVAIVEVTAAVVEVTVAVVEVTVAIVEVTVTVIEVTVALGEVAVAVVEVTVALGEVTVAIVEVTVAIVEVTVTVIEVAVAVVEVMVTVIEVTVAVVEVAVAVVEVAVAVVVVTVAVVEVAVAVGEVPVAVVEVAVAVVEVGVAVVEVAVAVGEVTVVVVEVAVVALLRRHVDVWGPACATLVGGRRRFAKGTAQGSLRAHAPPRAAAAHRLRPGVVRPPRLGGAGCDGLVYRLTRASSSSGSSMSQYNPAALPQGGTFHGRYQIIRYIKGGGMGAVYEVVHVETRRRRALKVMLPSMVTSAEMRERFKLEATVAADIESDHIVETFDAGVDPETGAPFLVMELLRGEDLTAVLARRGRLPANETVQILAQAAKALDKTHAAGIVHRDLKPDNLFLAYRDDDPPRLKILDFGIAKVVAQATQAQTRTIGTPLYMAPEQIKGRRKLGAWTDLYALGHIAYHLLVGEAYWAEDLASLGAIYPLLLRVAQGPHGGTGGFGTLGLRGGFNEARVFGRGAGRSVCDRGMYRHPRQPICGKVSGSTGGAK